MRIEIPGYKELDLNYLLLDYNGTIAVDGKILPEVKERIQRLSEHLDIYVLTADTHGTAKAECADLSIKIRTFPVGNAMDYKRNVIDELGGEHCVCLGNGRNDVRMFEAAALSIGIMEREGIYGGLLRAADLCVNSTEDGLDMLLHPKRIVAGLRG